MKNLVVSIAVLIMTFAIDNMGKEEFSLEHQKKLSENSEFSNGDNYANPYSISHACEDTLKINSYEMIDVSQLELCCCITYEDEKCCNYVRKCGSIVPGCRCRRKR